MLDRTPNHELRLIVSNGTTVHFTTHELHRLFASWQMWVLMLVGFLIMSTGHPVTMPQFDYFGLRLSFWLVALAIYLLFQEVYTVAAVRIWERIFGSAMPLIIVSVPFILAVTVAAVAILTTVFEPNRSVYEVMTWQMTLRNVFFAHVLEHVALLWLIPAQRVQSGAVGDDRLITLAGRKLPLASIKRVKSAEHYLEIHLPDRVETIRERMGTFLEQVGPEDGIQTHRSHWVSTKRVAGVSGAKLKLDCGNTVPIARGRMNDVRTWVGLHEEEDMRSGVAAE